MARAKKATAGNTYHAPLPIHDLVLTVRRLRVGSFSGLWELGKVMPDGTIKILTDANTKSIVCSLAQKEIIKAGM